MLAGLSPYNGQGTISDLFTLTRFLFKTEFFR
jgi:hypothetical protein